MISSDHLLCHCSLIDVKTCVSGPTNNVPLHWNEFGWLWQAILVSSNGNGFFCAGFFSTLVLQVPIPDLRMVHMELCCTWRIRIDYKWAQPLKNENTLNLYVTFLDISMFQNISEPVKDFWIFLMQETAQVIYSEQVDANSSEIVDRWLMDKCWQESHDLPCSL